MKALLAGVLTEVASKQRLETHLAPQGQSHSSDTNQESGSQCSCEKLKVDECYRDQ